jgi:selenide, water dikinase
VANLPMKKNPRLLVGFESSDDAGVYLLNEDTALIQTLDFFTPIVDSPFDFGRIAAANALSDIYAMGGEPITTMNIVCFPSNDLPESVLRETLEGGLEKIHESGAVLAGGHSVDDPEFKYGLSVTGIAHPRDILTNAGAGTNDKLILTKPIGTGILATAVKGNLAGPAVIEELVRITSTLNRIAAETIRAFSPTACTDITGFGLAGHLCEMARACGKEFHIDTAAVPVIASAIEFGGMGLFPAGAYANRKHFADAALVEKGINDILADIMFDPQTSGGLVYALPPSQADNCLAALQDRGVDARLIGEVAGVFPCGRVLFK